MPRLKIVFYAKGFYARAIRYPFWSDINKACYGPTTVLFVFKIRPP